MVTVGGLDRTAITMRPVLGPDPLDLERNQRLLSESLELET